MNVTGTWRIVSSPDFDDDYLRMEVEPYVELAQRGNRFAGMDEMDEVHGRGELRIEEAQAHFVLAYHQGDSFTFICERLGD